jgi:hypothetical protein
MFNYLGHPLPPDALKQGLAKAVKEKMAELQLMILAGNIPIFNQLFGLLGCVNEIEVCTSYRPQADFTN